ncbi:NAD(P)/FAD-dependent oxidoreductase [Actinotalea sp. K2]|uniref:phytoene desaturase family protein n=1 Tax=Actinotalea sp. K2 TaxID=2939438 RepID=UPI002017BF5B|nr:NAD(P)/FAD-dependent oxidoreductase [Actinotalea sp. K2]MCL3861517.1 NAD(P)/FAD-dependent oxidoreductase [Actinotalea sp. K2]
MGQARASHDVVVVGSGPNGLSAAVTLARSGLSVVVLEGQPTSGGGARTVDLGMDPSVRHDLCSAVHPMALASPFYRRFDLRARGVELCTPEISYAQPLADGDAGVAYQDLGRTAAALGPDGDAWTGLMGPLVEHADAVVALIMGDHRQVPREVRTAVRFGLRTLEQGLSATWGRRFSGQRAPALLTGVAAHATTPLPSLAAAGTALLLGSLAHTTGWSVPRGGTQRITDALVADLVAHGGEIVVDRPVASRADLPVARAYLFDTAPGLVAQVMGDRMPTRNERGFRRYRHGNAAAKVDFVLSGPVPWSNAAVARAGTVHVGGSREQMQAAEHAVAHGRHASRPVVLVSDPAVSDPSRLGAGGTRPLWTYAHVPAGSTLDPTEVVTAQIERYAPGFRDVVLDSRSIPASRMAEHNANYVGGDISTGAVTLPRMLGGPVPVWDPYATGADGVFLCSAAVPPGPGVHGMGGWHAARRVLRQVFGIMVPPDLSP